jgi:hypothetical protein
VVLALKTKFLLFWLGQEQDNCPVAVTGAVLSVLPGPMHPTRFLVRSPVQDLRKASEDGRTAARNGAWTLLAVREMQRHQVVQVFHPPLCGLPPAKAAKKSAPVKKAAKRTGPAPAQTATQTAGQ